MKLKTERELKLLYQLQLAMIVLDFHTYDMSKETREELVSEEILKDCVAVFDMTGVEGTELYPFFYTRYYREFNEKLIPFEGSITMTPSSVEEMEEIVKQEYLRTQKELEYLCEDEGGIKLDWFITQGSNPKVLPEVIERFVKVLILI